MKDHLAKLRDKIIGLDGTQSYYRFNTYEEIPYSVEARHQRAHGKNFPDPNSRSCSMLSVSRMNNLHDLLHTCIEEKVEGDFVECGVWGGGACIFAKHIIQDLQSTKHVWVCDSFQGFSDDSPAWAVQNHWVGYPKSKVIDNFKFYQCLDDQVHFVEGFFADTLPTIEVEKICVLRMDGDTYNATMQQLENLYDKVADNGYIIVDDYEIPECKQAVHEFLSKRGLSPELHVIDWVGVYWRKIK